MFILDGDEDAESFKQFLISISEIVGVLLADRENSFRVARIGFTLVELSIVLVIIGLLFGGILVAQNMIDSSRIKTVARDLSHYDSSIDNFTARYNYLPGDSATFSGGNRNGLVEDGNGTDGLGAEFSGEVANFWVDLEQTGTLAYMASNKTSAERISTANASAENLNELETSTDNRFTATVSGPLKTSGTSLNVPSLDIGQDDVGIIATNDNQLESEATSIRTRAGIRGVYLIAKVTDVTDSNLSIAPANLGDVMTPEQLAGIDAKFDDGSPNSGVVLAFSKAGTCLTGSDYNMSQTDVACHAAIAFNRLYKERKAVEEEDSGPAVCGNSVVESGEACDDGGVNDTCNNDCSSPACGDAFTTTGEQCDDGNTTDNDGCSSICQNEGGCMNPDPGWCATAGGNWDCNTGLCDGMPTADDWCGSYGPVSQLGTCHATHWDGSQCIDDGPLTSDPGYCSALGGTWNPCCGCDFVISGDTYCFDSSSACSQYYANGSDWDGDSCECPPGTSVQDLGFGPSCETVTDVCGNAVCDTGENANDCDSDCDPICGNSAIEDGEWCDGGGTESGGCDFDCTEPICGDGHVNTAIDQCDDGNVSDGDGCDSSCQIETSVCPNGVLEAWGGEQCDDGNSDNGDGCNSNCQSEVCGNAVCDAGENSNDCDSDCDPSCGNFIIEGSEWCDDGGNESSGCEADCTEPVCGDGHINVYIPEQCDDGNTSNGDGCSSSCQNDGVDCGCGYGNTCYTDPGWCATVGGNWDGCDNACDASPTPEEWCQNNTCGLWNGSVCDTDPQSSQYACECNNGTWNGSSCAL